MALDWQNCPRCAATLTRSASVLADLGVIVLRCAACRRYCIEGDDRWIGHEGDTTEAVSRLRERATALIQERDDREKRGRDMFESSIEDPRWQQW